MFSKKPATSQAQSQQASGKSAMGGSTFSIFGADVAIKGDVVASAELHVDGTIEGDITCAALVQGEASKISGAIRAESARLAGTVRGTVTVGELTILKSAHIQGDVAYGTLTIEPGAKVDGRLSTHDTLHDPLALEPSMMTDGNEPLLTLASSA